MFTTQTEVSDACSKIVELWYRRNYHMRSVNRILLSTKGLLRRQLGWYPDMPANELKTLKTRVNRILKAIAKQQQPHEDDAYIVRHSEIELSTAVQTIGIFNANRSQYEADMIRLSKSMPFWTTWDSVDGFTNLGLAVIIAEAGGDLLRFEGRFGLRKRLGLAPYTKDGVTLACSTWRKKGGLDSEDWRVETDDKMINTNGTLYKASRRSFIFAQIGGPIIGGMKRGPRLMPGEDVETHRNAKTGKALTKYQKIFVRRLRLEAQKDPEQARAVTKEGKESFSTIAAFRAQRVAEQKLIQDVWYAWRRAAVTLDMREAA